MERVIIASKNPVKVAVAKQAFSSVYPEVEFEFKSVQSESGVPEQPMNEETEQGALNRLHYVRRRHCDADYWISQEGGLFTDGDNLYNRAWILVCDYRGHLSKSSTALFYLPPPITRYIKEGLEFGEAADKFFSSVNSNQGIGAVGHLTDGLIDRENYYLQAAVLALSGLKHKNWYQQ